MGCFCYSVFCFLEYVNCFVVLIGYDFIGSFSDVGGIILKLI